MLREKISQGKAVIAFDEDRNIAGFCYIEAWQDAQYIANSGLVVEPKYRGHGLSILIKEKVYELSKSLFPNAKLFGLTTSPAVMKINSKLGYIPVGFSDLTTDNAFWKGCESCPHHHILVSMNRTNCLCTAMINEDKDKKV